MVVSVSKKLSGGMIRAIPSKSFAHRLLICAALADGVTSIECDESSDDIDATVSCLESLGAGIGSDGKGFVIEPLAVPVTGDTIRLNCGESGSTLRFLLPVCCALGVSAEFVLGGRLPERPMSPLLEQLVLHGCEISSFAGGLRYRGKLENGLFELPGDVSSQFFSGLLFALPLLKGDSLIKVMGRLESMPYINMTLDTLGLFGVDIRHEDGCFIINGGQRYKSPGAVGVEGDWSNAAFWLCAGAIGGAGVTCKGLNLKSRQGDMAIVSMLERFGANVDFLDDGVAVSPAELRGIRFDAGDTPDLVPILAVVAAAAAGETEVFNAGRLRIKESNRLLSVSESLGALGADIVETRDGLLIKGGRALHGGSVSSFGDHRIVMMAAIASTLCEGTVTIAGAEAVNKSYPGFFRDFTALGGMALSE